MRRLGWGWCRHGKSANNYRIVQGHVGGVNAGPVRYKLFIVLLVCTLVDLFGLLQFVSGW